MQSTISASSGPETGSDSTRADVLVSVATLITEGRIPAGPDSSKSKKFFEGPHSKLLKGVDRGHKCDLADSLCLKFKNDRETILNLCRKEKTLCIEVLLTCQCKEIDDRPDNIDDIYALEQWHFNIESKKSTEPLLFNVNQLASAIRSQLYFSQITAWLMTQDEPSTPRITSGNFRYNLTPPGETLAPSQFYVDAARHEFPATDIGNRHLLRVCSLSLPRTSTIPEIKCKSCAKNKVHDKTDMKNGLKTEICGGMVDDRMHTCCTVMGKHRCEEEEDNAKSDSKVNVKRLCQYGQEASTSKQKPKLNVYIENSSMYEKNSTLDILHVRNDLNKDKGQLLLDAIERSGKSTKASARKDGSDTTCDKRESDIFSIRKTNFSIYEDEQCDSPMPTLKPKKLMDMSNVQPSKCGIVRQKITFDDEERTKLNNGTPSDVPSPSEQAKFRKSLGSAASMVFHSRTGLPLTSSPAPARRGKSRFDFDSSINSVSAIKSALFSTSSSTDEESESDGSVLSPCSPETVSMRKSEVYSVKYRRKGHAAGLLGSFEESVLNGRLEPVSTVHGFTAELGASGSFVPKHLVVPVTVFFYNLGDNDKVSTPYLSHINLGKKGYNVPKSGTVQVTLFNPLGTVVKMFVIMYDLSDMPANSQTFMRQRTLYMPTNCKDRNLEWGPKWLRYLIHLRFISSKSGKIYLHSDIRMIIFRKSDMDTATAHGLDMSYELRSFTHLPANPKFSPRK